MACYYLGEKKGADGLYHSYFGEAKDMKKLHKFLEAIVGLRKLIFSIGAIFFIALSLATILVVFIVNWYLGTAVITGDNLTTIVVAGFQYCAVIVSAYLAVNVANKYVGKLLGKKK